MKDTIVVVVLGGIVLLTVVFLRTRNPIQVTYGDVNTVELIGNEFNGTGSPAWHSLIPAKPKPVYSGYTGGSGSGTRAIQPA